MSADWTLRRAGEGDAHSCALVAAATFLEAFAGVLDGADILAHLDRNSSAGSFARWIADPASVVTLAEAQVGSAPIGYTLLTTPDLPIEPQAGDVELKRIYTLAPFHGSGLGAALMEQALADARHLGHRRLLLGVHGGNRRAQRFYGKQGFAVIGTRRFLVGATWHDDLVFGRAV
ncbi:GNAT family N-acetyltransferase [Sphingomonas aracearum]|uniref:GNAT family N-acetyltransferase n=1 Tax=Sphingomonas aracearum TaxID=2283317 RepID=UPI001EF0A6DB|nr:GNAT family N-acetyltransferase [Sphingomonas aracearum]